MMLYLGIFCWPGPREDSSTSSLECIHLAAHVLGATCLNSHHLNFHILLFSIQPPCGQQGLGCPSPAPSVLPFLEIKQQSSGGAQNVSLCGVGGDGLGIYLLFKSTCNLSSSSDATLLSLTDQVPCS